MDVRVGPQRRLSTEELILLNCGVGQDSWEFLGLQETKPVDPKGNQSWIFIGRTDAEAETPILWPPDTKSQLTGKTLMLVKIEGKRRRGQQNEMVGWHHRLNGFEFEQTTGVLKDKEAWHAAIHGVAKSWTYWPTEKQQQELQQKGPVQGFAQKLLFQSLV